MDNVVDVRYIIDKIKETNGSAISGPSQFRKDHMMFHVLVDKKEYLVKNDAYGFGFSYTTEGQDYWTLTYSGNYADVLALSMNIGNVTIKEIPKKMTLQEIEKELGHKVEIT